METIAGKIRITDTETVLERPEAEKTAIGAIKELYRRYPQSHMCILGCNLKSTNGEEAVYSNYYHECGSPKMIDTAAVDCCLEDTRVAAHYRNVFLTCQPQ